MTQALAVFQRAQLFVDSDADVAVRADGKASTCLLVLDAREGAVAEVGFCDGAQAGNRTGAGKPPRLVWRHVRAVDQAPARVHLEVVEQPLDGPRPRPSDALLHLKHLLCGMDVDANTQFLGNIHAPFK